MSARLRSSGQPRGLPVLAALGRLRLRRTGKARVSFLSESVPREGSAYDAVQAIRSGVPARTWADLRDMGFTTPERASILGISEKTIARKLQRRAPLDLVEGDRTPRLAQMVV